MVVAMTVASVVASQSAHASRGSLQHALCGSVDAAVPTWQTPVTPVRSSPSGSILVFVFAFVPLVQHMYMETQNAVATMIDGDSLRVTASTQAPGTCQAAAMAITGLPGNKVDIVTRRVGGGFGGKLSRMLPVVAAASLGSYVTGRQVHVQLERCQDMIMVGRGDADVALFRMGKRDGGV